MRDSIIFYRSFYEAINSLPLNMQPMVYSAIFEYSLNFNQILLEGLPKAIFTLIKPQLDANNKRYENGSKGGRKNQTVTKPEPNRNQTVTEIEPNKNVNVNDNVNDNVKESTMQNPLQNSNLFRKPKIPPLNEVFLFFKNNGGNDEMAKKFYDKWEGVGWYCNNSPIVNYSSFAQNFILNYKKFQNGTKNFNLAADPSTDDYRL